MRMIRTVIWVLLLVALVLFSINNWSAVAGADGTIHLKIWEGLIWETRLPALVVLSVMLGWLPTWLVHLAGRWRLKRRISALESVARQPSASLSATHLEQAQLDAARQSGETPPVAD